MSKVLGIRDAARQLGLAHTTIGRYIRANPELNRGSRGRPRVDLDELRRHRSANLNPAMRGSHAGKLLSEVEAAPATRQGEAPPAATRGSETPNYALAKAVRETVLAQRARVDLDEKRGLLVPRAEIQDAIYDAGAVMLRDMLELGPQLSERLAAMDQPREIAALLESELRRVLATLAASLQSKTGDDHPVLT